MIKIHFQEPTTSSWKCWRQQCADETKALLRRVAAGHSPNITDLYKHPAMMEVYKSSGPPFYEKCAYCESEVGASQFGDIEHWRPKGRVTDEFDQTVVVTKANGTTVPHPGYYWLAYDWRNLLYSCLRCNRPNIVQGMKIGKASRFPVIGFRAERPGEESREAPLLLNPLKDDPSKHLTVSRNGVMIWKTPQGKASIDILGLNLRQRLITKRLCVISRIERDIKVLKLSNGDSSGVHGVLKNDFMARIRSVQAGSTRYSAAARSALQHHVVSIRDLTGINVTSPA